MKRKDGRYSDYVFLGYTPEGKEKRQYVYAKSKQELNKKLLELRVKIATGKFVFDTMRLDQWSEMWLKGKQSRSKRTYKMYSSALERYIIPVLGKMDLKDIKIFHIQELVNNLSDRPRTCEIVQQTLSQMFEKAVASELMINNPADSNRLDMPVHKAAMKRSITEAELSAIQRTDLTEMECVFIALCLGCGLRRSEALGVMKQDIKSGKLAVNRAVQEDGSICPLGKSASAKRTLPLDDETNAILTAYRPKSMYLIHNSSGTPLNSNQFGRFWNKIKYKVNKTAGGKSELTKGKYHRITLSALSKGFSPHMLRHSYATKLSESGYSPAEIKYLMGHSTARLALEVYTHVSTDKITADRLNGVKTGSNALPEQASEK